MADLREILGKNLRRLRSEHDLTQEELADRAGITVRYLGKAERAQASVTLIVLGKLAGALDVPPPDLLRE